jgi:hypothetical protein
VKEVDIIDADYDADMEDYEIVDLRKKLSVASTYAVNYPARPAFRDNKQRVMMDIMAKKRDMDKGKR